MNTPAALSMQGVTKFLGGRKVLKGIDLEVAPREVVALLGPNGAGKSTLLRVAATVSRPDEGAVHVHGVDAKKAPEAARARLGYLTQDPGLYDELTPAEHVAMWARLRGTPVDASRVTAQAGLAQVAHRPCNTLSRGQRQRVSLALATLGDSTLLILDEPFAALDADGQRDLESLLRQRDGRAALITMHDEAQARRLADRVLRLDHHRLVPA